MKRIKRWISLLLVLCLCAGFGPVGNISADGAYECAWFPAPVMQVTQLAFENYSHGVQNAIDISPGGTVFAPFTGKIVYKDPNWGYVVLQSSDKVIWPNGTCDYMSVGFMHDENIGDLYVGKVINQGENFYHAGGMGDGNPNAYGDHVHITVHKGKVTRGYPYGNGDQFAFDAFFINKDKTPSTAGRGKGYLNGGSVNQNAPTDYRELWKYLDEYIASQAPANLGDDFYAPILNKEHWKIIENNNGNVQTADENGKANQVWRFQRQSDGSYKISNCLDGRCLDVADASSESGAKVWLVDSNDTDAQRWYIYEESGGYILRAKCTNCVLDLPYSDPTNGNQLQMFTRHGEGNQIWAIYRGDECQLKEPTLSVQVGTATTATKFTWTEVYGERWYDVRIWKDTLWEGDAYHDAWGATSGYEIVLPAGTYHAYVDAGHEFVGKMSNVVTFTVAGCNHTYKSAVTKPTCTERGYTTYTCTLCGDSYTVEGSEPLGHDYTSTRVDATCVDYGYTIYTCAKCGDTYTVYDGDYTEWSTTKPVGVDEDLIESKIQYRYADKETTTSYEPGLSGWTQVGGEWKQSGTGSVTYVKSWPSGFEHSHSLYGTYNNTPRSASETTTDKTTINSDNTTGYLYYHWCRGTYTGGPINRLAMSTKQGEFVAFHAFYSTTNPSTLTTDPDGSVIHGNASCCKDSYWYYYTPVSTQNYTTYRKLFTYERWGNWSDWSDTVYTASTSRKVETRTLYRTINGTLGEHKWGSGTVTKAPTTSAEGTLKVVCLNCSGTTTVTLPKLNTTDYTYQITKAATCNAAGTGRYTWKTTTYGSFYFDVSIAATGHSYSYKATKAPTTSATGTLTGTCSKCSGTTTVTLPKLNTTDYTYQITKAATCTAAGTGRYTWKTTTYGSFYFDVSIAATGHTYTSKVTAPTCTEQGYTTYTCACGHSYKDNYTPATGHSYSYKATKAPTTSATGTLTGTCSKCSGTTTVTLPKLNTTDYTYAVTKAATCTAAGTGRYTWKTTTYGSFYFDVSIAATGHTYTSKVTAPTCTEQGYTTHTCICGDSYVDSYTEALGHNYVDGVCTGCGAQDQTPDVIASGSCGANVTWTLTADGTLSLNGTGSMTDYANAYAPWHDLADQIDTVVMSEGITNIGQSAFMDCVNLTSVTIPDTVRLIWYGAFWNCSSLKSIDIPESVYMIRERAFMNCTSLEQIELPDGISRIWEYAFYGCTGLTSVKLPSSLTRIDMYAFENCTSLAEVNLPESLTIIESCAFKNCDSLIEIIIPAIETLGNNVFENCDVLTKAAFSKGLARVSAELFKDCASLDTILIPDSVTEIGHGAFMGCQSLEMFHIPEAVTAIGYNAFSDCIALRELVIPDSVKTIGASAFENCDGITTVYIPDSVVSMGNAVFKYCSELTEVRLPGGLTEIGQEMFYYCVKLRSVEIPSGVSSIGYRAFCNCQNLMELILPNSLTYIGPYAFSKCCVLDQLVIPEGVTKIDNYAFFQAKIASVFFMGDAPNFGTEIFREFSGKVYYPIGNVTWTEEVMDSSAKWFAGNYGYCGKEAYWTLDEEGVLRISGVGRMTDYAYKSQMPWYAVREDISKVVIKDGIINIGNFAFYGMPNLQSVDIADGLTQIGDYAFKNCANLHDVVLPETLSQLGDSAFYACTSLTSIEIPAKLYTIKAYTFKNCTNLTEVIFNEGNLQKISDGAFYNTGLTELVLPDCLDIMDVYAFKNCSKLTSIELGNGLKELREAVFYGTAIPGIEIPEGITRIGPYAFKNCVKLVNVELPESLTSVGEASFYACTALERLALPDAVTKIGNYAFRKCGALVDVQFGAGLTNIGESSFYGCEKLVYLAIPGNVTTIQGYAFKGCTDLEIVELPESLKTVGDSAFHTCTSLSEITIPGGVTKIGEYCFSGSTGIDQITFEGNAPAIGAGTFNKITAIAYYPEGNTTWTSANKLNYGGKITWRAQ